MRSKRVIASPLDSRVHWSNLPTNHGMISTCPRNSSHTRRETTRRGLAFAVTSPFLTASSHVMTRATKWRQLSERTGTAYMYAHAAVELFIRKRLRFWGEIHIRSFWFEVDRSNQKKP